MTRTADYTATITINAEVTVDGDGSAQFVNLTVKGSMLEPATVEALVRQVAADCNIGDAEDIDILKTIGTSNNLQELVKKHGGFKFNQSELVTTYMAEVAFHNDTDDDIFETDE